MPRSMSRQALVAACMLTVELLFGAGCTMSASDHVSSPAVLPQARLPEAPADPQLAHLGTSLGGSGDEMVFAAPGTCGPSAVPVLRVVLPEHVLFATASDQPGPGADATLEDIANKIVVQAPDAELTVVGHTDAVGSDAYNINLSKRRALTVLRGLAMRGLDPNRLSAVAIGKRQPIADDATPDGRARNRRVEFFVSRCLEANLNVLASTAIRRGPGASIEPNRPVEVMRLDPAGTYGLATVSSLALHPLRGTQPLPAPVRPSVKVARPAPPPHYQPRTLSPDVEPSPLGPAVPF